VTSDLPVTIDDIRAAADRLAGLAVRTPLLESPLLNDRLGARLLVKAEPLQRTGSFKFRGAYNAIAQIPPAERARGVVGLSSGNHAQGVAHAAQLHGIPATIVMPTDAPAIKKANTQAYGAAVVEYDRYTQSREEIADALVRESGAHLIRPYDDVRIIAGQGTVGLEISQDCADRGIVPDLLLCNASGGGLIAGTAIAVTHVWPDLPIWAVEPEGFDDMARSLASGRRERVEPGARSICDALLQVIPGEITFPINKRLLAGGLAISDDEALAAMATAFEYFKLVVEPGGAAALAAALSGRIDIAGRTVVVVASGGNLDPEVFIRALAGDRRRNVAS